MLIGKYVLEQYVDISSFEGEEKIRKSDLATMKVDSDWSDGGNIVLCSELMKEIEIPKEAKELHVTVTDHAPANLDNVLLFQVEMDVSVNCVSYKGRNLDTGIEEELRCELESGDTETKTLYAAFEWE